MAFTCDSCRKPYSGSPTKNMTGRSLCRGCADTLLGAAAGVIAGQTSGADYPATVAQGVATGGIFGWVRHLRRPDRRSS